jgi:hypothetical protein
MDASSRCGIRHGRSISALRFVDPQDASAGERKAARVPAAFFVTVSLTHRPRRRATDARQGSIGRGVRGSGELPAVRSLLVQARR